MWPLNAKLAFGASSLFLSTLGVVLLNIYGNPANVINVHTAGNLMYLGMITVGAVIGAGVIEYFKKI